MDDKKKEKKQDSDKKYQLDGKVSAAAARIRVYGEPGAGLVHFFFSSAMFFSYSQPCTFIKIF